MKMIINGAYLDQCKKCSSKWLVCRFPNEFNIFCSGCESRYKINDEGKCSLICSDKNCLEWYLNDDKKEYLGECQKALL